MPGEVHALRADNAALDKQVRELKDANRRLDGLIGREAATAEALVYCQAENREISADVKELKASAHHSHATLSLSSFKSLQQFSLGSTRECDLLPLMLALNKLGHEINRRVCQFNIKQMAGV